MNDAFDITIYSNKDLISLVNSDKFLANYFKKFDDCYRNLLNNSTNYEDDMDLLKKSRELLEKIKNLQENLSVDVNYASGRTLSGIKHIVIHGCDGIGYTEIELDCMRKYIEENKNSNVEIKLQLPIHQKLDEWNQKYRYYDEELRNLEKTLNRLRNKKCINEFFKSRNDEKIEKYSTLIEKYKEKGKERDEISEQIDKIDNLKFKQIEEILDLYETLEDYNGMFVMYARKKEYSSHFEEHYESIIQKAFDKLMQEDEEFLQDTSTAEIKIFNWFYASYFGMVNEDDLDSLPIDYSLVSWFITNRKEQLRERAEIFFEMYQKNLNNNSSNNLDDKDLSYKKLVI